MWSTTTVVVYVALLLSIPCVCGESGNASAQSKADVFNKLMTNYDPKKTPGEGGGTQPTTSVGIGLFIQEIYTISDARLEFATTILVTRTWIDERLAYSSTSNITDNILVRDDWILKLWVPDVFFVNERESSDHNQPQLNKAMWLSKDGTLKYSTRVSLVLSCSMDLHAFPMDMQNCVIQLESYSYNLNKVRLTWSTTNALQLPPLFLQSFELKNTILQDCRTIASTGGFSCLQLVFQLRRNFNYHLITRFFPSAFVVCLSWVAFWVSPDSVPGRTILGSSTVLTIVSQYFIGGLSLAQVPYIKAVDVWMAGCMIFVFCALVEFAIVNNVLRTDVKRRIVRQSEAIQIQSLAVGGRTAANLLLHIAQYVEEMQPVQRNSRALKIDRLARIIFPTAYAFFVIFYWTYYLTY